MRPFRPARACLKFSQAHGFDPRSIDLVINTPSALGPLRRNTVDQGAVSARPARARYIAQRGNSIMPPAAPADAISYRAVNYNR